MSRAKRGMGRGNVMGPVAEHNNKTIDDLFEKLEPFFNGVLVDLKKFDMKDRAQFNEHFNFLNGHVQNNVYDSFITAFKNRIRRGFDQSIRFLQQFPIDENFPKQIKNELDKFDYAKQAILSLFKPLSFGASTGSGITIEKIVLLNWNTDYLKQLNDTLHLTRTLTTIFSTSRRNGNTQTVLPVKTILKYYEDNDNSQANPSVTKLIPQFVKEFVKNAKKDYEDLRVEYMTGGIHVFLMKTRKFIEDEDFRLANALIDIISKELQPLLVEEYIMTALEIIYSSYDEVIEKDVDEEFQAIIKLFDRVNKLEQFAMKTKDAFTLKCRRRIAEEIEKHKQGEKAIPLAQNPVEVMNLFFTFLDELTHKQKISFLGNTIFEKALNESFKNVVIDNDLDKFGAESQQDAYMSKIIATYFNKLLSDSKLEPDADKQKVLIEKACMILNFVGNKDIFENYYSKNFLERLVAGKSISLDMELVSINNLSKICDRQAVDRFNTIYTDYDKSKTDTEKFRAYCTKDNIVLPKLDFEFLIFGKNTVPSSAIDVYRRFVHPNLCNQVFLAYSQYISISAKRISLDISRSHGVVQFTWMKRPIQMVSRYTQIAVLLAFNEQKQLTYAELGQRIGLEPYELNVALSGIVSKGILTCSTDKTFQPESVFQFNMSFKPRTTKFAITTPDKAYLMKEDTETDQQINEQIEKEREIIIQARQVRIMKQRRTMRIQDLINETIDVLRTRFNITSRMARKQIEILINKEYFKRSETDREVLEYIA